MKLHLKFILLALASAAPILASPQPGRTQDLKFEHLTDAQGLSQNAVFCILQDRQGFIWFGTQDGLNRYDGYNFTIYRHNPADSNSISDNYVTALYEDRAGKLWIGTHNGGLNQFDPITEKFVCYRHDPQNSGSLSDNHVSSISEDSEALWIGTHDGLNRLNRTTPTGVAQTGIASQFNRFLHDAENPKSLSNNYINAIHVDRAGGLWIGTAEGGLNRYDRATGNFTHYTNDPDNPHSLSDNCVFAIFEDKSGALWLGTSGYGLNKLVPNETQSHDRQTVKFKRYRCQAFTIVEDNHGLLWIGTRGLGLYRFDRGKEQLTRFAHDPTDPFSLSDAGILSAYVDRAGDLWLGTHGYGINKYSRTGKAFRHYGRTLAYPNSLANRSVRAIYADEQGALWIGGYDGLDRFDRRNGKISHYQHDPGKPSSLPGKEVFAIYPDPASDGKIFLIGFESNQGLAKFDRATGSLAPYPRDPASGQGLIRHPVYVIHRERSRLLWVGTDAGLFKYDEAKKELTQYTHDPNNPQSLGDNRVLSLCEETSGTLWVGTEGGGLNRFERETDSFTRYQHDPRNPFSLSHDRIKCLYAASAARNVLWIGTDGGGLNRFDREHEKFLHYTTKDGLPNDVVYAILEDDEKNLWLSTNKGLSKFNPRTLSFRNFEASDGLQSNEFNTGAYFKSPASRGEMFFGGINGVTAFFPDQIKDNPCVPPVVFTGFKKLNQPVKLDTAISEIKRIKLDHKDAVFSFEFAALNYTAPEKNRYAFRLEGFNKDWVELGTKREATFTNLDPGEYVLRIKGSNNDGVWNEAGVSIAISIAPAFYQTRWFAALGVLALGLTVYGGYRWRLHHLEARERELERLVAESTEQLRESEARYRTLVENSPDAIYVHRDGKVLYANPASAQIIGAAHPQQLIGKSVLDFVAAEYRSLVAERMQRIMQEGITLPFIEVKGIRLDGAAIEVETMGLPIIYQGQPAAQVIVRDITQRKRMEEQLRQYTNDLEKMVEARAQRIRELEKQQIENEKLAATGRMAARIAHEINNPLGMIQTAFRLISHAVPVEHRHHHYVGKIEKEIDRIAQIVRQMLDLHKPHQESPKAFRADEAIGEVIALMKPNFHERRLCCEQDLQRAREIVTLPENMLRQILYNVMLNAAEASPANGLVRITAEIAADRLQIAVSDRGTGIPEEIKARIFEPFFTTKNNGSTGGMGLGLSICKSLIEAMNGSIELESKPGEGTVCRIAIPLDKNEISDKTESHA